MTEKNKKSIFAVVDLAKPEQDQKKLINYVVELSQQLDLPIVFYPQTDKTNLTFDLARTLILSMVPLSTQNAIVSKRKISMLNFFTSLCDVAKKEQAKFIVYGIQKNESALWSKTISTTEKSTLPVLLIPDSMEFSPIKNIVIAADSSFKLQKTNQAIFFAKSCGAKILIFKENNPNDGKIEIVTKQISTYLYANDVQFEVITAENEINYAKHMFKYASKHAQMLIIEVNPGKLDTTTKKNIQKIMGIDTYASRIPVLISKTVDTMKPTGKF